MARVTGDLNKVNYRKKDSEKISSNFAFVVNDVYGIYGKFYWQEGVGDVWNNKWFTPQSCSYCDDVFAELADVVLRMHGCRNISDSKGANLIIVRSVDIDELIICASEQKRIHAVNISLERVIISQAGCSGE